jgi:sarcosine oxidase gamma subunit
MSTPIQPHGDIELEAFPTVPVYELVTFRPAFADDLPPGWPKGPGEARRNAAGSCEILRIAADRWLILNPRAALVATLAALSAACALTDVTGKWREFRLTGTSASRLLANSIDVAELLAERDCARTALFDCPALLYKLNSGFAVWVERSYERAFAVAVERARNAQARAT